ncbi:MBG-2 domain-containing protein, partial [Gluconacetobacter liquefaciens]
TALNQTGTYGQTPNLGTSAYSTTGLVNGDSISGVTLATAATTQSEAGTYAIAISGAQGSGLGNYTVSYQAGVYTIQPAPHQVDPTAGVSPIFWPVMAMGSSVGVAQAQSVQAPTTPMIVPVADATADAANGNRTHDTLLLTRPRVSVSADPTLGNGGAQGYRIVLPSSSVSN